MNDLADLVAVLRVVFTEHSLEVLRMLLTAGEDDGFTHQGAAVVLQAVFHQVVQNDASGVEVEDAFADLAAFKVDSVSSIA
ncbi:hypothetical protein D3C85_1352550 [compost metagenome]